MNRASIRTADNHVQNHVVFFTGFDIVLRGIINEMIGPDFTQHGFFGGVVHSRHFTAHRFGDLQRKQSDAASSPVNQDHVAGFNFR